MNLYLVLKINAKNVKWICVLEQSLCSGVETNLFTHAYTNKRITTNNSITTLIFGQIKKDNSLHSVHPDPVPAVQPWFILEKIKSNYTFSYKLSIGSSSDDMCPLRSHIVKEYWKIGSGHGMGSKLSYITRFTIPKLSANYQEDKLNRFRVKFDRNFPTWKENWSLDKQEV